MIVSVLGETDVVLKGFGDEGFHVEAADEELVFGPMQMFVTALGMCSFSVLASYGEQLGVDPDAIEIRIRWSYVPAPYRIEPIAMEIDWPNLPSSRMAAARRAAEQCTLHHTLGVATEVRTRVSSSQDGEVVAEQPKRD